MAAEAVLSLSALVKCYWDWPVGLKVGITDHCLKEISTVRFLVQVKSFFQLILLFVPSGLPLLLLLHTSNGFSLDPVENKLTVTPRERRTVSFRSNPRIYYFTAFTEVSGKPAKLKHSSLKLYK